MVSVNNLGDNSPLDENGEAITLEKGAVLVAELDRSCAYFDGIVKGFVTEEQKSAEIIVCAFAVVKDADGNAIAVDYLADKTENGKIASVSYNSIIK